MCLLPTRPNPRVHGGFMNKDSIKPHAVSRTEAAAMIGIGKTLLNSCVADGRLASFKIGRRRLILVSSIEALIDPKSNGNDTRLSS